MYLQGQSLVQIDPYPVKEAYREHKSPLRDGLVHSAGYPEHRELVRQGWKCSLDSRCKECKLGKGVCNSLGKLAGCFWRYLCDDIRASFRENCSGQLCVKCLGERQVEDFQNPYREMVLGGLNYYLLSPQGGALFTVWTGQPTLMKREGGGGGGWREGRGNE